MIALGAVDRSIAPVGQGLFQWSNRHAAIVSNGPGVSSSGLGAQRPRTEAVASNLANAARPGPLGTAHTGAGTRSSQLRRGAFSHGAGGGPPNSAMSPDIRTRAPKVTSRTPTRTRWSRW